MKLEDLIKQELKGNIVEARKNPLFKDPKTNLLNEKIVTIADCIRIAEKYAALSEKPSKEWVEVTVEPKDVGFFHVFNNYVNVPFPIERAYWDGLTFRPIDDNGNILTGQSFLDITHYAEPMDFP